MGWFAQARRIFLLFVLGCFVVVLVAIGLYFLILEPAVKHSVGESGANALLPSSTGPRDSYHDPNAGAVFLVPSSRIPQTQAQRVTAAADTLLPDRWASNADADTEVGPSQDVAKVSLSDRHAIINSVSSFLKQWETFAPANAADQSGAVQAYANRLAPWVDPANLSDIANRVDNSQGAGICPQVGCVVGSSYDVGDVWDDANVRFDDGVDAYVTVFANVTYHATLTDSPLDGATYQRSYGLLLTLVGGRWLITRAAAASNGLLP
jgi:hypothetical protein